MLANLKKEILEPISGSKDVLYVLMAGGITPHLGESVPICKAYAAAEAFTRHKKHIYQNDLILGSLRGRFSDDSKITDGDIELASSLVSNYGQNTFATNADHFAPDYAVFLADGIPGTLEKIASSKAVHEFDILGGGKKAEFLSAAEISMKGFAEMVRQYASAARELAAKTADREIKNGLFLAASVCDRLTKRAPSGFREALQLVWLVHIAFQYENRYAMALGRLDQYLYPYYLADIEAGRMTRDEALRLVEATLIKIGEHRYLGGDDVVNIAIAGVKPDGTGGLNELSYVILEAVKNCNIPGPNLSARIYDGIDDAFLDECLKVIGTGLGYPALMNDEVNIPALYSYGYSLEDCRDYCMVGCIENFIAGKQPPWSDGRFNSPKYIELALNNGRCLKTGVQLGPQTGEPETLTSMSAFLAALTEQLSFGAKKYAAMFNNDNDRFNKIMYSQPFLSCFCRGCIESGLDINNGGAIYPSVHGAGCMGIGTFADSLAAVEEVVFNKRAVSLSSLRDALAANFEGFDELRALLKGAPKYGNDLDAVDKYAVWFVDVHSDLFSRFRTRDGGFFYIIIAANVNNIPAGHEVAATPDGRGCSMPLSDAASPSPGADKNGPTAVVLSTTKPDYKKVACGTVLNQKFSPSMFSDDENRAKLLTLIKVYFQNGGQEIQINSVSRETLIEAIEHPESFGSLVVRVSGFSAYYTTLDSAVQQDILGRTEHE